MTTKEHNTPIDPIQAALNQMLEEGLVKIAGYNAQGEPEYTLTEKGEGLANDN